MYACKMKNYNIVKILIENGANINDKDKCGFFLFLQYSFFNGWNDFSKIIN